MIAPRVKAIRDKAAEFGRDPRSIKVFASITPVIGVTREEAERKFEEAKKYASEEGGLVYWCANTGIDLSKFDPDKGIIEQLKYTGDPNVQIQSKVQNLAYKGDDVPVWTPNSLGKAVALGASGPVPVGTPSDIADEIERWIDIADLDGFNVGHITAPGTWEDVVDLLVPELRKRGIYAPPGDSGTMRERVYGQGQSRLRDDHVGSQYKYQVYTEN